MNIKIRNTISFEYIWRMNPKWYISLLIILLTLIGVNQQQNAVPNQEIVVQFNADAVTSEDTQNTINIVKAQLQSVGANNIKVQKGETGTLKITYYSDVDVSDIKKALSNENTLEIGFLPIDKNGSKYPSKEHTNHYNFDVFEIQKGFDSEWDLNGTYVAELKPEGNRFSNSNIYAFIHDAEVEQISSQNAYKVYSHIAIAIDNTSYKIPEVRAGPLA